jgi:hypothetical protein
VSVVLSWRVLLQLIRCFCRYVSIVHGGQAAIDAAVLKLFPEWIDNVSVSAPNASERSSVSDHFALSSSSHDGSSVLKVHDDLDDYLLEMDKDSVSGCGFSFIDGSNSHSDFATRSSLPGSRRHVSKDSASFVSVTDAVESVATVESGDSKSVLDMLSITATRLRLLKRAPQVAGGFEAGDISCSDLDAGEKYMFNFLLSQQSVFLKSSGSCECHFDAEQRGWYWKYRGSSSSCCPVSRFKIVNY